MAYDPAFPEEGITVLENRALALSDYFLPKVDYARSCLDAKAIEALNLFECEVEAIRYKNLVRKPSD